MLASFSSVSVRTARQRPACGSSSRAACRIHRVHANTDWFLDAAGCEPMRVIDPQAGPQGGQEFITSKESSPAACSYVSPFHIPGGKNEKYTSVATWLHGMENSAKVMFKASEKHLLMTALAGPSNEHDPWADYGYELVVDGEPLFANGEERELHPGSKIRLTGPGEDDSNPLAAWLSEYVVYRDTHAHA